MYESIENARFSYYPRVQTGKQTEIPGVAETPVPTGTPGSDVPPVPEDGNGRAVVTGTYKNKKVKSNILVVSQANANQTIALVEYFLKHYEIDFYKVYINGYSDGVQTLSLVLEKKIMNWLFEK